MVTLGLAAALGAAEEGMSCSAGMCSRSESSTAASETCEESPQEVWLSIASSLGAPQRAPPAAVPEHLEEAFDKLGVADELLCHWEAIETKAFARSSKEGEHEVRAEVIDAKVRGASLWCLQQIFVDVHLPTEALFDAAALLDSYIAKAAGSQGAAELLKWLPLVVTVIARTMKRDDTEVRGYPYKFNTIPAWVAQHFGSLGHPVKVASLVSDQELAQAEHHVLSTLEWRVNLPTLASWTTAFFKRLDVITENQKSEQIRAAWQRTLFMGLMLITKQAPTVECPAQRMARGLLVLSMMRAESGLAGPSVRSSLSLEAAAGVGADVLQEDCRVAVAVIRRAGYNPWGFASSAEAPAHHSSA